MADSLDPDGLVLVGRLHRCLMASDVIINEELDSLYERALETPVNLTVVDQAWVAHDQFKVTLSAYDVDLAFILADRLRSLEAIKSKRTHDTESPNSSSSGSSD